MNSFHFDISNQNLVDYKPVQQQAYTSADISGNRFANFTFLAQFRSVTKLRAVSAGLRHVSQIPVAVLLNIESLVLAGNELQSFGDFPECMPKLRVLDVSHNPFGLDAVHYIRHGQFPALCVFKCADTVINSYQCLERVALSTKNSAIQLDSLRFGAEVAFTVEMERAESRGLIVMRLGVAAQAQPSLTPVDVAVYSVGAPGFSQLLTAISSVKSLQQRAQVFNLASSVVKVGRENLVVAVRFKEDVSFVAFNGTSLQRESIATLQNQTQALLQQAHHSVLQSRIVNSTFIESGVKSYAVDSMSLSTGVLKTLAQTAQQLQGDAVSGFVDPFKEQTLISNADEMRLSTAKRGQFIQILPAQNVRSATFFQSVITFNQLVSDVISVAAAKMGVALQWGHAVDALYRALRQRADFYEKTLVMQIELLKSRFLEYKCPVQLVPTVAGQLTMLAKEGDRIVFAQVMANDGYHFLSSSPVQFAEQEMVAELQLQLIAGVLVAVLQSSTRQTNIRYTFYQNGVVVQDQQNPYFALRQLQCPAGAYHVAVSASDCRLASQPVYVDENMKLLNTLPYQAEQRLFHIANPETFVQSQYIGSHHEPQGGPARQPPQRFGDSEPAEQVALNPTFAEQGAAKYNAGDALKAQAPQKQDKTPAKQKPKKTSQKQTQQAPPQPASQTYVPDSKPVSPAQQAAQPVEPKNQQQQPPPSAIPPGVPCIPQTTAGGLEQEIELLRQQMEDIKFQSVSNQMDVMRYELQKPNESKAHYKEIVVENQDDAYNTIVVPPQRPRHSSSAPRAVPFRPSIRSYMSDANTIAAIQGRARLEQELKHQNRPKSFRSDSKKSRSQTSPEQRPQSPYYPERPMKDAKKVDKKRSTQERDKMKASAAEGAERRRNWAIDQEKAQTQKMRDEKKRRDYLLLKEELKENKYKYAYETD